MSTPAVPTRSTFRLDRALILKLALGTLIPLGIVAAAVVPGIGPLGTTRLPPMHLHAPDLSRVAAAPPAVQMHLAAVLAALAVGIVLLAGVKGSRLHRTLGWTWVVAMAAGAGSSFFIRIVNNGALSYIHLLAGWTLVALPMGVAAARRHKATLHARTMTGLFLGGLILAGLLAFAPGRLMWRVFFG